jgi:opacity protein-like surface antigen
MKKILALCAGLALLPVSAAFAQDAADAAAKPFLNIDGLSVSGSIQTGLRVVGGTHDAGSDFLSIDSGPETVRAYAYSAYIDDGTPFRAQLVLQYEKENFGLKTRFRYQPYDNNQMDYNNPFDLP